MPLASAVPVLPASCLLGEAFLLSAPSADHRARGRAPGHIQPSYSQSDRQYPAYVPTAAPFFHPFSPGRSTRIIFTLNSSVLSIRSLL